MHALILWLYFIIYHQVNRPMDEIEGVFENMPYFYFGMVLSTSELYFDDWRPLDRIRKFNLTKSILRDLIFAFLFFTYGGYMGWRYCAYLPDGYCAYVKIMSFNHNLSTYLLQNIASIQIMLMALVSPYF